MSLENANIAVVDKNTIVKAEALRNAKTGAAVKIKAIEGGKYILAQGEHGIAPENITVQRVGKDLHVMLEGTDANSPQLIIEDYFDKPGELVGKGEDGQWHQFISTDGDSQHDAAFLIDGESSPLALGANTVASLDGISVADGVISPALLALGALAALGAAFGLGYLIAHHNNNDNSTSNAGAPGPIDDSGVAMPELSTINDTTGVVKGPLTNGQSTDETQPVFSGTGTPGNTIELRDKGVVIGTGKVGTDGTWTVVPEMPLAEGSHSFDLVAKNPAGAASQPTTPVTIIVDLTPPDAATDLLLSDNVGSVTGAILANSITDDNTPTYSGKAEPNSVVIITDGGVAIGSAAVNAQGEWTFTPREPMSAGEHSFSTIVQDSAGNQSQPTPPLTFVIDPNGLSATINYVVDDTNTPPVQLTDGSLTRDNTPTLHGTGTARTIIFIYEEGSTTPIGSARVLGDGSWSYTPPALADGHHAFVAIPQAADGTRGNQSPPFDLDIDTHAPTKPGLNNDGIESIWDDVGLITGPIAHGGRTDDTTPTLKGSHLTKGDIVYIYDGANELGSAVVGDTGGWTFTPSPPLNPGEHNFAIVVGDPAGNRSERSDPWLVIIDTTPPPAPLITEVTDDVGTTTGPIAAGGVTDDAWPTVHGTAEANSLIIIYDRLDNGARVVLGSTTADELGNWVFTPEMQLSNGHHSLSAAALDDVRNTSQESAQFDFDLVTGGIPSAPAITSALDDVGLVTGTLQSGATTDDTRPTLKGTAPANSLVTLYVDHHAVASFTSGPDGHWSWTPVDALPEGLHNFSATATDATGNVSVPTGDFALIIDTTAPAAADDLHLSDNVGPVQGEIADGSTTDDNTPTFSGKAEPGSTVIVSDNGKAIGSAAVQPDGSWSFTPETPLPDGHHEFSAVVQDPAGNLSPATPAVGFDVDTSNVFISIDYAEDNAGSITGNLSSGAATDDATPTLHGKAKANAVVQIFDGSNLLGSVEANAEGAWQFTSPTLSEGLHHITATATDASGASATSSHFDLNIDLTAPGVGDGIVDVWDNVGPVQGLVPSNGETDDNLPTLRGSGLNEGEIVTVRDGDLVLGTAKVGPDGNWSFTPISALEDGAHDFTIVVTDPVGNTSEPSDPYTVIIDTELPTQPVITEVFDDQGGLTGPIAEGGITDDALPKISGSAQEGTLVKVYDNNQLIGSAIAGPGNVWTLTPDFPLPYGPHSLHAVATDKVGNISAPSDAFGFELVTGGIPSAPSIIGAVDDVGSVTGMLSNNDTTDDTKPTLVGNAPANSLVTITLDDGQQFTVPANEHGQWSWTPDTELSEGEHGFSVVATDALGNVSAPSGEFKLIVDLTAPAPAVGELTDNVGDVTGVIADGSITDDSTPTFSGTAEPDSVVIIRDGDQIIGSTPVDGAGNWSFTPETPLTEGPHELSAEVRDAAGNSSGPGTPIHFVVDTSAAVVSIDYAEDNEGTVTGNMASGAFTDDSTPTLHGKATANAIVTLYDGSTVLGTALASPFGEWSFTPDPALAEGPHSFSAAVTNGAGNTVTTAPFNLDIDLTAPVIPGNDGIGDVEDNVGTITGSVPNGGTTDDSTPKIIGSGLQEGDIVTIRDGDQPIGTAVVGDDGSWEFTPNPPLNEGSHDFSIIVTDPAGNSSEPSDPWTIVIDVTPPAKPEISFVVDDQGDLTGNLANGAVTDDAQPEIHGTAEANSVVNVYDNGTLIGSAAVDGSGNWVLTPSTPLTGADHALTAKAVDKAGNVSAPSDAFDFSLVEGGDAAPQAPAITGGYDDVDPQTGALANGDTTNDVRPLLSGTGHEGDIIELFDGTQSLGTAIVKDGVWSMEPNIDLSSGAHNLTAVATNAAGNHSGSSNVWTVVVDVTPPAQPTITLVVDDQGDLTGNLANGDVTDDTQPEIHGTAEANSVVNVYDNGTLIGSAAVDGTGNWVLTPSTPLTGKDHVLTAKAVDKAGNVSVPSDAFDFSLVEGGDAAAQAPAITGGFDDVEPKTGDLANGDATNDQRPLISGTGHEGDIIELFDGTQSLGTAVVHGGVWSIEPNIDLSEGPHTLTAVATNAAGNHSAASNEFALIVDITAPVIPGNDGIGDVRDDVGTVTGTVPNGESTDDTKPTLSGDGLQKDDIVIIRDGDVEIGTAIVGDGGAWEFTPSDDLAEGDHDFNIVVEDPAGNRSNPSDPWTIVIDLTPPAKPAITFVVDDQGDLTGNLANGDITDDAQPEIHGTAEANSVVNVYDNGTLIGSAAVDGSGNWVLTPSTPLTGADHALIAKAVDKAGNVSVPSDAFDFSLVEGGDAAAQAPVITGGFDDVEPKTGDLVSGDATNDQRPLLSGTGHEGDIIELFDGTLSLGTAIVHGGVWSMEPNIDLSEGHHTLTAVATNAAGNHSAASNAFELDVDLTAPTHPGADDDGIRTIVDDVGPKVGDVANGGITDDTQPTLKGDFQDEGSIIYVYDNGTLLGSTVAGEFGDWAFTPDSELAEGDHVFTIKVEDRAGWQSDMSDPYAIIIDTTRPDKPAITEVIDDQGAHTGPLTPGEITDDAQPQINGTAEPKSVIYVYDGTTLLGSTSVSDTGSWSYTPTPPLQAGLHSINVVAQDAAGLRSDPSDAFDFSVLTGGVPSAVAITSVEDNAGSVTGNVPSNGFTDDTTPTVRGTAPANTLVTVTFTALDGTVHTETATSGPTGSWSVTPPALAQGRYSIVAAALDPALNPIQSGSWVINIDTTPPAAPVITTVMDDVSGGIVGNLPNGSLTNDNRPTINGTAESGSVIRIYDGSTLLGSVTATGGNWSYTTGVLGNGAHSLKATATDAAGNVSGASAIRTFTVDTTAPAVAVQTVMDDVSGGIVGNLANGSPTNDNQPTLNGTAEAGSIIRIYDGATLLGSITATGGTWSYTTPVLSAGSHSLTATATDPAGNTSAATAARTFTVDTTAPGAPAIDSVVDNVGTSTGNIANGGSTDDSTPTLNGHAEANSVVKITLDGTVYSTTANGSGVWSFNTPTLALGNHSYSITATDAAGNTSTATTRSLTVVSPIPDGAKGTENFEYATAQQQAIVSGAKLASGLVISCSWSGYAIMTVVGQGHHAQLYTSATHATRLTWGSGVYTTDVHFDLVAPTATAPMQPTVIKVYSSTGELLSTQTVSSASRFNYVAPAGKSIGAVDLYVAGSTDAAPAMVGFDNVSWGENASGVITTASIMGDEVSDQPVGLESVDHGHDQPAVQTAEHETAAAPGSEQPAQPAQPAAVEHPSAAAENQPVTPVSEVQPQSAITLTLDHAEQPINFSAVVAAGETVSKVDMTNAQPDTLNITLEDVLTHGEANAFIADGAKQMLIQGEKGDVVNLSDLLPKGADASDWSKADSPVNVDGVQYEVYQHGSSDAELLIQLGVQTNLNNH